MVTVCSKNTSRAYLHGNTKQWVEYVTCEKTEECPLYKTGKCACFRHIIGSNFTCPNGTWHRLEGYTRRAGDKFTRFQYMVEKQYAGTAEETKEKIATLAGYVYVPLSHLTGAANTFEGVVNDRYFPVDDFNEDLVERLVSFVPRTWFGNYPIHSYIEGKRLTSCVL